MWNEESNSTDTVSFGFSSCLGASCLTVISSNFLFLLKGLADGVANYDFLLPYTPGSVTAYLL